MTFDDTRDNVTDIEAQSIEADAREEAREADHIRNSRHIRLVDGVVRSKPFMDDYLPEQDDPEHDPIGDADTEYDIEYDDGQPSEYEEWQDYMGGDDWDHGQYDDCGW
jgi:hypothetical protein